MADEWTTIRFRLWAEVGLGDLVRQSWPAAVLRRLLKEFLDSDGLDVAVQDALQLLASTDQLTDAQIDELNTQIRLPLEVSAANLDFGLNEIPSCTLSLAVGRDARDVSQEAWTHTMADHLKEFLPVSVYMSAENTSGTGPDWPKDANGQPRAFRIFDGRTVGSGYRMSSSAAEFSLFLTHWLSDLHFSSALSRISSPANPFEISFDAAFAFENSTDAGARRVMADAPLIWTATTIGNLNVIGQDFWGYSGDKNVMGLKGFLTMVSSQDRFNWANILKLAGQFGNQCPPDRTTSERRKNDEALRALARFEPLASEVVYTYGIPFGLQQAATTTGVTTQIGLDIGNTTARSLAHTTIWDKLVGKFASDYSFAVVPMVERALVVPLTPGLRSYRTLIEANEYEMIDINTSIPRPLRGVGLMAGRVLSAGANGQTQSPQATGQALDSAGALYDTCRDGLIHIAQGPHWLNEILAPSALNAAGNVPKKAIGEGAKPVAAGNGAPPAAKLNEAKVRTLWTAYCRSLYIREALRHRQARISGRLRLDLAPGSSVALEVGEDRFVSLLLGRVGGLPPKIYGTVLRTSIALDAEAQRANTAFHLGYLRSEAENSDDNYSTDQHALWIGTRNGPTIWCGAPLVEDDAFGKPHVCQQG